MNTRELCKCWISSFLFFGRTVKETQVRLVQSRFLRVFLQGEILSKIFCFTENIKSDCSGT